MILKTVKALKSRFNYWLGVKLIHFGYYLTESSRKTIIQLKAERFAPFKEASNQGKEILTIVEEGKLGPIFKN